jgi:hypothetical protein
MPLRPCRLVLTLIAVATSQAVAATVALSPSKDNSLIQRTDPNAQLSNAQGDMVVGRTGQDGSGPSTPTISIRRGLVAFNVAGSVPAGATITGVTLTMRETTGMNGDRQIELHRVLEDWGEGTSFFNGGQGAPAQNDDATWLYTFYNFANPVASPTWTTAGGSFSPTVSGSTIVYDSVAPGPIFPTGSSFTWSSASNPQMIADVQNWLDSPTTNFGWLLKIDDESIGQTAKRLASGESATAPLLEITYVHVPEPSTFVMLTAGCLLMGIVRHRRRSSGE